MSFDMLSCYFPILYYLDLDRRFNLTEEGGVGVGTAPF
jgi:hypothetical protein